jgi:hypothetical protein
MKHRPKEEQLACIDQMLRWYPEAQRVQRQLELLEEVLSFGEPATPVVIPDPASSSPPTLYP